MKLSLVPGLLALNTIAGASSSLTPRWPRPVLELPYATYEGYYNESSGLDVYLGVRYAQSTAGENRFRAAQPPLNQSGNGTIDATTFAPQCVQSSQGDNEKTYNPLQTSDSEDCLFLNIYAPYQAKDLPVFVWIHGGGWDFNSAREFDPTPMILYSNSSFIGVIIQYRLGAFGGLASSKMGVGNSNFQVTDANFALEWVQKYAESFGGDPSRVTIGGESAGGGTILQLYGAYGDSGAAPPWKNAFVASPYMVTMGGCDDPRFHGQEYTDFANALNCTNGDIECLRGLPTQPVRIASSEFGTRKYTGASTSYCPCVEGPGGFLTENAATRLLNGPIPNTTLIAGNNYNDGPSFVSTALNPSNNSATFQADADYLLSGWLTYNFMVTHQDVITTMLELYPLNDFADNRERAGQVYGDIVFACPINWALNKTGSTGYRYLYSVLPATHAQDNAEEFPYFYGGRAPSSPSFYASFIGPLVSLITTDDPNSGSPDIEWPTWSDDQQFKVLNLSLSNNNISDSYISNSLPQVGTEERCAFWGAVREAGNW
ncbi:Alpha/Beta hydrolase protein [Kockovaella imperatae]|uniref:Carboxylic ester hydrolase n=1 Tax=Kockovaella imperatae TaxID=4999 RepID=A0A1Y1UMF9_9TREE|nr:Alpha/Beta hydrolase protein [Kockovaella imperatae]ORX38656.1 Alpha/Beta hydrolase protein [Kockovaella imperatae]